MQAILHKDQALGSIKTAIRLCTPFEQENSMQVIIYRGLMKILDQASRSSH